MPKRRFVFLSEASAISTDNLAITTTLLRELKAEEDFLDQRKNLQTLLEFVLRRLLIAMDYRFDVLLSKLV